MIPLQPRAALPTAVVIAEALHVDPRRPGSLRLARDLDAASSTASPKPSAHSPSIVIPPLTLPRTVRPELDTPS